MSNFCPCKDCNERFLGCHSICDNYKNYKSKVDELKKTAFINKTKFNDIQSYVIGKAIKYI
jgi:5-formaminoimidazole-4-carboxamide-1-beta-D-ribofuranosyl 5'-monophosphate synthetase